MTVFPILKTLLHSFFGRRATLKYPSGEKKVSAITRGRVENDINSCIFCGICQKQCPTGAIKVTRAEKTWSIARFDCMQCARCVELCPKKCLRMSNVPPDAVNRQEYFSLTQPTAQPEQKENA